MDGLNIGNQRSKMGLKKFIKDVAEVCVEEVEELDDTVFGE